VWLPAFQRGEIRFDGDSAQLAFALRAAENPDALAPLVAGLESGAITGDERSRVVQLVGELGGAK
jgi:hypothetical protein